MMMLSDLNKENDPSAQTYKRIVACIVPKLAPDLVFRPRCNDVIIMLIK